MVERLKSWESPRKRGRNDKGKGGSARARQLRKREQMLRQKLKTSAKRKSEQLKREEREYIPSLFFVKLNLYLVLQSDSENPLLHFFDLKSDFIV